MSGPGLRWIVAGAVAATCFAHLLLNRGRDLSHTESWVVMSAAGEHDGPASVVRHAAAHDAHPPLHPLLVHVFEKRVSASLPAIRAFNLLGFLPGVAVLLAFLGRRGGTAVLLAAGLVALGAYPSFISCHIRSYALMFSWAACYYVLAAGCAWGDPWGWGRRLALGALVALMWQTHYVGFFLAAGVTGGLLALRFGWRREGVRLRDWVLGHALGVLLFLPWGLYGFLRQLRESRQAGYGGIPVPELWWEFVRIPFRFFFLGLRDRAWLLLVLAVALLAVLYLGMLLRSWAALAAGRPRSLAVFLPMAAATYTLLLASMALGRPVVGFHYFVIFYPLAVWGVSALLASGPWRGARIAAGLGLVLLGAWTARVPHPLTPWAQAADWLAPRLEAGDRVVVTEYAERGEMLAYRLRIVHGLQVDVLPLGDPPFYARHPELPPPSPGEPLAGWLDRARPPGRRLWLLARAGEGEGWPGERLRSPDGAWTAFRTEAE